MKTPKVDTAKPKNKFNTPKAGLVRKSLGHTPAKNLKKLTAKGADHVLSMVKDNEENIDFKSKAAKARMSLPANALSNKSPTGVANGKTPKKSPQVPKQSKKQSISNNASKKVEKLGTPLVESKQQNLLKTPVNKNIPRNLKTPVSVENNSSPIKPNVDAKKSKVPFNLDDSLLKNTPNGSKQTKKGTPAKPKPISPEAELGLQLEVALSPKSKKEKMKKIATNAKLTAKGKIEVTKKAVKSPDSNKKSTDETEPIKKSRKRNRKAKSGKKNKAQPKPSMLKHNNVLNSVNALLKATEGKKNNLLEPDGIIFMQFNLIKVAKEARGVYKVQLPHSILPDNPEVCLFVPDLKGKRNDPEEAIDHYKELLKKNNVTAVTEIIPFRKLKQEYEQFEERRKLSDRIDIFISDGRIMRPGRLGKRFARSKKIVSCINLSSPNLKEDINEALKKVALFCSGNGTSYIIKCGRRGMPAKQIADNIVKIGEFFANNEVLVGQTSNITTIILKTEKSAAFPIYVSTVTPNEVKKPQGKKQSVEGPVEDEVTTVQDATVVVYPSGKVKVNKRKNQENNEEIAQENPSKKAKTNAVKLGEVEFDSDESDDESYNGSEDEDDEDGDVTDSEVSMDEDGEEEEEEDEDEDEEVEGESDIEEDNEEDGESLAEEDEEEDDQSSAEEEIELAEKEYLQEFRQLQDEAGKPKLKKAGGKVPKEEIKGKQTGPQGKKQQTAQGKVEEKKGKQITQQNKKETVKQQGGKKQTNQKQLDNKQSPQNKGKPVGQGKGPNNETQNKGKQPLNQGKGRENSPQNKGKPFGQGKGRENSPQNKGKPFGQGKGRENSPQNKGKPIGQEKENENSPQNKGKPFGQGKGRGNSPQNKGKPFGQGKGRENSPQNKGKPFGQRKGQENSPHNKGKPFGQGKSPNTTPQNKGKPFGRGKGPNNKGSPGAKGNNQQNFKKGAAGKN